VELLCDWSLDCDVRVAHVRGVWVCVDCALPASHSDRVMSTAWLMLAHLQEHVSDDQRVPQHVLHALSHEYE
jgi:hypothetical protein